MDKKFGKPLKLKMLPEMIFLRKIGASSNSLYLKMT